MSVLANPEAMLFEVEGHNGEWFTIAGKGEGDRGVTLGTQIDGIWDSPFESIWNSHAFQIGADFGGIREDKQDVAFGVHITDRVGTFEENDSEFRKAWHKKKDSNLWVTTENSRRYLPMRLSKAPEFAPEIDPIVAGYGGVVYHTTAGFPRWLEPDKVDKWVSTTDTTGVVFNPANPLAGASIGHVTISNPTDEPIWLKWVLQGYPGARYILPDFSFGDDRFDRAAEDADRKIVMPPAIAGDNISIDTDETKDQVTSTLDLPWYIYMQGVTFCYPVPEYTKPIQLPVAVTGAPAGVGVQVRQPRTWSRPIGMW